MARWVEEGKAFAKASDAATRALARLLTGSFSAMVGPLWGSVCGAHTVRVVARLPWPQKPLALQVFTNGVSKLSISGINCNCSKPLTYEKELVDKTHQLATLLGEDHGLAVLRETLAADPLTYGGHHILKGVFAVIDQRRGELERQAFAFGQGIYKEPPGNFTSRIEALMHYQEVA